MRKTPSRSRLPGDTKTHVLVVTGVWLVAGRAPASLRVMAGLDAAWGAALIAAWINTPRRYVS